MPRIGRTSARPTFGNIPYCRRALEQWIHYFHCREYAGSSRRWRMNQIRCKQFPLKCTPIREACKISRPLTRMRLARSVAPLQGFRLSQCPSLAVDLRWRTDQRRMPHTSLQTAEQWCKWGIGSEPLCLRQIATGKTPPNRNCSHLCNRPPSYRRDWWLCCLCRPCLPQCPYQKQT